MMYRRLCKTVSDKYYKLVDANTDFIALALKDSTTDYYTSIFMYNEEQYAQFKASGSIRGIDDVTTNWLVWDFDAKGNFELVRNDVLSLTNKLQSLGLSEDDFKIFFSGSKGFHVEIHTTSTFSVKEFKAITKQLANGLESYDKRINDHARAFRIPGSKHQTTGLYKIPLYIDDLKTVSESDLLAFASNTSNVDPSTFKFRDAKLPSVILNLKEFEEEYKVEVKTVDVGDIDWTIKPKFLSKCRFSLQNGVFGAGDRNNALLCLAATYKNQGFDQEITYRMLKGVAELQVKRNGGERYSDSELYNNIILQVYSDSWKGGIFSCKDPSNWLHDYCQALGRHKCNQGDEDQLKPKKLEDIHASFKNYVVNIEKNTIKTGIPSLDKAIFLSTGANVGIIGSAGSGKTSIALDIVSNTSKAGVHSVLASLDMHYNRLFEKALYRVSGLSREDLYDMFKNNREGEIMAKLKEEFGNVNFFHKSAPTVSDLRDYILACQEQSGQKVKLVMLDYFERVSSDLSEDTAASKRVAGELQDLVNDLDICLVTLVQPNKMSLSAGPDCPIMSYTSIKGSSYVYQAFRIIVSLWRPFYNPKDFSNDRYMQMAVLKNDLGELAELDFGWQGKRGLITELDDFQRQELRELLAAKAAAKDTKSEGWG